MSRRADCRELLHVDRETVGFELLRFVCVLSLYIAHEFLPVFSVLADLTAVHVAPIRIYLLRS